MGEKCLHIGLLDSRYPPLGTCLRDNIGISSLVAWRRADLILAQFAGTVVRRFVIPPSGIALRDIIGIFETGLGGYP
jgi:hypothetical protein